jgi:hypothetical protein
MNFQKFCFATLLFATIIAVGPASATCSDATLKGVWGYQVGAAVGHFTSDGQGNITSGSQTVSENGTIKAQTYTGTYTVRKNCTGGVTVKFTGGGSSTSNFIVDDTNKGLQVINTVSGGVAGGFGLAQGTATCGLIGKKAIFAANLFGGIVNVGPIDYLAQVILSGTGKVSGSGTFDVNGTIVSATITGTYTENSDCTGTIQMKLPRSITLNFNSIVVNGGKEILLIETDPNTVVAGSMQQ